MSSLQRELKKNLIEAYELVQFVIREKRTKEISAICYFGIRYLAEKKKGRTDVMLLLLQNYDKHHDISIQNGHK